MCGINFSDTSRIIGGKAIDFANKTRNRPHIFNYLDVPVCFGHCPILGNPRIHRDSFAHPYRFA